MQLLCESKFIFVSIMFCWTGTIYDLIILFRIFLLRGNIISNSFYGTLCLEIKRNQLWLCCHAVTMWIPVYICFYYVLLNLQFYDLIILFRTLIFRGGILFDYFYGTLHLKIMCNQIQLCCHAVTIWNLILLNYTSYDLTLLFRIFILGGDILFDFLWHSLSKKYMQSNLTVLSCSYYVKTSLYLFPLCSVELALCMTW